MIKVANLTKIYRTPIKTNNLFFDFFDRQYKENVALNNISFEIDRNELVGFIGPNGAGKTTTLKILSGILFPTSGSCKVLGFTPFEKKAAFLKQIAFVMGQKNQLLWELPAIDTFELNKEIYEIDDYDYKNTLTDLIDLLDCQEVVNRPVKTLSLGQRMRVELIASLLHRPKILFLDEPTIGLDIFGQTAITNFIKEYQQKYKSIVILTSHYMQDVKKLSKRVILIDNGKIIFDGLLKELVSNYSQEKTINITLNKPLEKLTLPYIDYNYQFPQFRVKVKKENLAKTLSRILNKIDYNDVTIEDEPIEEVIKKIFKSS